MTSRRLLLMVLLALVCSTTASGVVAGSAGAAPGFAVDDLGPGHLAVIPGPAATWVAQHPGDRRAPNIKRRIATQPTALWVTGSTADDLRNIGDAVGVARRTDGTITVVLYNIPGRNDGLAPLTAVSATSYRRWVDTISRAIGPRTRAIVVVEPDALWFLDRQSTNPLSPAGQRLDLLRYAVSTFTTHNRSRVYVDAGTASGSVSPARMATLLLKSGVNGSVGFAVNTSSFAPTRRIQPYAQAIRGELLRQGGVHSRYVVDTSRNGNPAWDNTWCNPAGRKVGAAPGPVNADGQDFNLWIKQPGQSDGPCGVAPRSRGGEFLPATATDMISR